ncbi:MAG TPA: hypothetical protein VFN97_13315 [Actinospica sp.]|nr:hypothetical protein [Actinospica sp.]
MTAASHDPRRRRGVGVVAAVAGTLGALGLAGCGIQSSSMKVVGAAPTLQAANDATGTGNPGGENQYSLYFFRDHKLTPVVRYTNDPVTQALIMAALIKGPDPTDTADGFTTAIPEGLSIVSFTARDQQWNYQYSEPVGLAGKAEIICSIQADLNAPSVGTATADGNQVWNYCSDFSDDFGAPAYLPSFGPSAASPTDTAN